MPDSLPPSQSRAMIDTIFDHGPDGMLVVGRDGRISMANERMGTLFGYASSELVGLPVEALIPDRFRERHVAHREGFTREARRRPMEASDGLFGLRSDGTEFPIEANLVAVDLDGERVVLGSVRDITARVEVLRDLREAQEAILERERDFRRLVDNIPGAFWRIEDSEGYPMLYFSEGARSLTGFAAEDIMEKRVDWAEQTHPEDVDRMREAVLGAVETKSGFDVTYRFRTASGETRWLREIGVYFERGEGQPGYLDGYILDVNEQMLVETSLAEAKEAAEAANHAKSAFLANMSHEIRTPMNAILGFSQLMARDAELSSTQRANVETILRSGEHLLGIINDVLEMSKIEAGRARVMEGTFNVRALLEEVVTLFVPNADAKGLIVSLDVADSVPAYVRSDERKIRQVLLNLVGNAVKFTTEGGVAVRARASSNGSGGRLRLEVDDTGPGISDEQAAIVFHAFEQGAAGPSETGGTGLGLPIGREFARLLGGDLTYRTRSEGGSTFVFEIPVGIGEAADAAAEVEHGLAIGLVPGQDVPRVLVVDDREENRLLLARMLQRVGIETLEAVDGQEAVEMFERWRPGVVFMDIKMPVMDGFEATERIRSMEGGAEAVVAAVSASVFEEDVALVEEASFDDFVVKPFRESRIFDALERHAGLRFLYEDVEQPEVRSPVPSMDLDLESASLPTSLLEGLREASSTLDVRRVEELLREVERRHAPLADRVRGLAADFDFDGIVELLEQVSGDD